MRILAICPSSRGFGFAVLEPGTGLVDWGVKTAKGDKNADSLRRIETLLKVNAPNLLVLEDAAAKGSRRAERIRSLTGQIIALAKAKGVRVKLCSRTKLMSQWADAGTKHDLAVQITAQFPELAPKLPSKREAWESEDPRLDIFKAVALSLIAIKVSPFSFR